MTRIVADMANRFYTNCALCPGEVSLTGDEAHHLVTVSRIRVGDSIHLFNGDGHEYPSRVVSVSKREAVLEVLGVESPVRERPHRLEIASAVPKGDRADFLVEKLTELGVTSWVPLRTERSVVHPHVTKLDRLRRTVIEASKQCGRNVLMQIAPLSDFSKYAQSLELPQYRQIAHPGGAGEGVLQGDRAIMVGPEGGFSESEINFAIAAGWEVVTLGRRILRVETAAIVAAASASEPPLGGGGPNR